MTPEDAPDFHAEVEAADRLLGQADALLKRHRAGSPPSATPDDMDDLPVLTEVVEEVVEVPLDGDEAFAEPDTVLPLEAAAPPSGPDLVERMLSLDADINRAVEDWINAELPQLLSRELDALADRLRERVLGHARATLLSTLSDKIAENLSEDPPASPRPRD